MKIELDNPNEKDLFLVLLSSFISMSELEEDERDFINKLHTHVTVRGKGN